jgi:hypothetical protein
LRLESLEKRELMTTVSGDFNGDGAADSAVGVPSADVGRVSDCGAVNVV